MKWCKQYIGQYLRHAIFLLPACLAFATVDAQPTKQAPPGVFATQVKRVPFVDRIQALGTLKANEAVTLSATVTETVTAIHFDDGQRVKIGDILVEMTSKEEHAQLEELHSTVGEALRQYDRVKSLRTTGSAPESLLDQRRREYETAKARLQAVQSRLQDRLVIAPFNGIVGIRNISVGALVKPGDLITTLDDDTVMKLDFTVPATYLSAIKDGLEIVAKARALPEHIFNGTISSINFRIDPVTRSVLVRALLPNKKQLLRPGLLMSVELLKDPRQALVIPEEAIISEGYKHFVYVIETSNASANQGLAKKTEIQLGARRPGEAEISKGLEENQWVITHGMMKVRDNSAVIIRAIDEQQALTDLLNNKANDNDAQ